eukprot:1248191-Heterocapsa_arctica.AAC.1
MFPESWLAGNYRQTRRSRLDCCWCAAQSKTCLVQNPDIKGSTSKPPQTCQLLGPRVYNTDSATFN